MCKCTKESGVRGTTFDMNETWHAHDRIQQRLDKVGVPRVDGLGAHSVKFELDDDLVTQPTADAASMQLRSDAPRTSGGRGTTSRRLASIGCHCTSSGTTRLCHAFDGRLKADRIAANFFSGDRMSDAPVLPEVAMQGFEGVLGLCTSALGHLREGRACPVHDTLIATGCERVQTDNDDGRRPSSSRYIFELDGW